MKMKKLLLFLTIAFLALFSQAQKFDWAKNLQDKGLLVTVSTKQDAQDNLYVLGSYKHTITRLEGGGDISAMGKQDAFVAKYDAQGEVLWCRYIQSTKKVTVVDLELDDQGNLYVLGNFFQMQPCILTSPGVTITVENKGKSNVFLSKYNSEGGLLWAKNVAWGVNKSFATDLTYNATLQALTFVAWSDSDVNLGTDILAPEATINVENGYRSCFVAVYDHQGEYKLGKSLNQNLSNPDGKLKGTTSTHISYQNGEYYIYTSYEGDFDLGVRQLQTNTPNTYASVLLKYNIDFSNLVWSRNLDIAQSPSGNIELDVFVESLVSTPEGIYILGNAFQGTPLNIDASSTTVETLDVFDNWNNGFILKFDLEGNLLEKKSLSENISERTDVVSMIQDDDNFYVSGYKGFGNTTRGILTVYKRSDLSWVSEIEISKGASIGDKPLKITTILLDSHNDLFVTGDYASDDIRFNTNQDDEIVLFRGVADRVGFLSKLDLCLSYDLRLNVERLPSCSNLSDGKLKAQVYSKPGVTGTLVNEQFTYEWSYEGTVLAGVSTDSITDAKEGIYTVTATSDLGCTYAKQLYVNTQPEMELSITENQILDCPTSLTDISVEVENGSGNYTYAWEKDGVAMAQITPVLNDVGVGNYQVSVTDAGCNVVKTAMVEISSKPAMEATLNTDELTISCPNATDGQAWVLVQGGSGNISYTWENSASATYIANDLSVGEAYVIVKDETCNIEVKDTVNVVSMEALATEIVEIHSSCSTSATGGAKVLAYGGIEPITYEWRKVGEANVISNTEMLENVEAGEYEITVKDVCNTTGVVKTVTIESKTNMQLMASVSHTTCGNSNGMISVMVQGGTEPYTYEWRKEGTLLADDLYHLDDVSSGEYTVKVTDVCGSIEETINVNASPSLEMVLSSSTQILNCESDTSASVFVLATYGVEPYTYAWKKDGAALADTTNQLDNVGVGLYEVTVTDACGTQLVDELEITSKSPLALASGVLASADCSNGNNGKAYVTGSSGILPYTYAWENSASTSNIAEDLSPGWHKVTVTDVCRSVIDSVYIDAKPNLEMILSSSTQVLDCASDTNASAFVLATYGVEPYNFVWEKDGEILVNDTINRLAGIGIGDYKITVTDACGTELKDSIKISSKAPLVITSGVLALSDCANGSNGKAYVSGTAGISPYTYAWENSASTESISDDLNVGWHKVTVTDVCGSVVDSVYIDSKPELNFYVTADKLICKDADNGKATVTVEAGIEPYTFDWGTSSDTTIAEVNDLSFGQHKVVVTDACGVAKVDSFTINTVEDLQINVLNKLQMLQCENSLGASNQVVVSGGKEPYTYLWSDNSEDDFISDLGIGTYTVKVEDACATMAVDTFYVEALPKVQVDALVTQPLCFGDENGEIELKVNAGVEPYTVEWQHTADNDFIISGLKEGYYVYKVSDKCGDVSDTVYVQQPDSLSFVYTVNPISDFGKEDGQIEVSVKGGTPPYEYMWNNSCYSNVNSYLAEGSYDVVITDANDCAVADTFAIEAKNKQVTPMKVFTPNGDGKNDKWTIYNIEKYPDCVVKIFNEWGNLVFESKGYTKKWDGLSDDGKELNSSVYYYVIELNNGEEPLSGSITILK